MPKLLALFQHLRQVVVDEPELRVAAEQGLEELVELLSYRHGQLQLAKGPAAQRAVSDADTRVDTRGFIRNVVRRASSQNFSAPGSSPSTGDLQIVGQFTSSVLTPEVTEPSDDKENTQEVDVPPQEREIQRRRSSASYLSAAADRTVYAGILASAKEEGAEVNMLQQFKEGFIHFKNEIILHHREFFRDLANAQHPTVMVIACCDSRVDPALLLGAGPGDIFIVRNIANLVPPFERQGNYHGTSAALEYAVRFLKVKHIMVIGHKNCGGIKALMSRADIKSTQNEFIDNWMEIAAQACERTKIECGHLDFAHQCSYCERESVNVSLANLLTFPFIKEQIARRALELHGWYYDIESAMMDTWQLRYQITDYERLV